MSDGDHVIITTAKGRGCATCIHVWERGKCSWIMSNSGGPKDCMVNDAMALFGRFPLATGVAEMSLPGPVILYLIRYAGHWEDVTGLIPQIEIVA
jgi:hypothetical protein